MQSEFINDFSTTKALTKYEGSNVYCGADKMIVLFSV